MINVRFNGYNGKVTSGGGGCVPCGRKRRTTKPGLMTTLTLIMPSGRTVTFQMDMVYEIAERDYEFLALYGEVEVGGVKRPVFEVV